MFDGFIEGTGGAVPPVFIQTGEQTLASQLEWRYSRSAEFALDGDVQVYVASGMTRRFLTGERETLETARLN